MTMRVEMYGGLNVHLAGGPNRKGGGDGPVVILLHGFGASGDDLASLWQMLRVPDTVRFAFPVAPLQLHNSFAGGRAWWMLDIEQIVRDATSGRGYDLNIVPNGLAEARERLLTMLDTLDRQWGLPAGRVFLGGFSQGAMLACDTVARAGRTFAGLIIMSGSIMAQREWESLWPSRAGLPVFQSHGANDPILACDTARQLRDTLRRHGLPVAWHEFPGGHEIPPSALARLGAFLNNPHGTAGDS